MWIRSRFKANEEDFRPVKWPPVGPYWCSGYGEGYSIVIAYTKTVEELLEFWPEAKDIDAEHRDEIIFTDRFPKPDWWNTEKAEAV